MKHLYICRSKIEGLGVNAGENIKAGQVITRVEGPIRFKVNKNKKDALANPNWFGIEKDQWIEPGKPHKFLNHSCNPNAGMRGRTVLALRDINEGEEITIDYSIIEADDRWELNCLCGAENCRKTIRSIQSLPQKTFQSYLPYIPRYFQEVYRKYQA